jgi:hypothetical protein
MGTGTPELDKYNINNRHELFFNQREVQRLIIKYAERAKPVHWKYWQMQSTTGLKTCGVVANGQSRKMVTEGIFYNGMCHSAVPCNSCV